MEKKIQPTQRNLLSDELKGYACLLVLFGHVIRGIREAGIPFPTGAKEVEFFIWSFHVPLFMFLSGFVFHITGEYSRSGSRVQFIKHKLLNLGVPYVVFSVVYILLNSLSSKTNTSYGLSSIFGILVTPVAQYWYLHSLLLVFSVWAVLSLFLKNWQIMLLLAIANCVKNALGLSIPVFGNVLGASLCFGMGTCLPDLVVDKWSTSKKVTLIAVHLILAFACILPRWQYTIGLEDFLKLLGIAASIAFISLICEKSGMVKSWLLFVCRYSLPIYLLHTTFTSFVRIVLMHLGIRQYLLHVVLGLLFGFWVPVAAACIAQRVPALDFFFYPSKNIKRLRSAQK